VNVTWLEIVSLFVGFVGLAGPALALAGLLVRRRQGLGWHVAGFVFAALLAGAAVCSAVAPLPFALWGPLLGLALAFLCLQLWQLPAVRRLAAASLGPAQGPRFRWGVLLAACPLLALWLVWRVESLAESSMPEFRPDFMTDRAERKKDPVTAVTDAGRAVTVYRLDLTQTDADSLVTDRNVVAEWAGRLIRTAPADPACNCHGWVYAGGHYWVNEAGVEAVLADNGYRRVVEPQRGDVVAYRDEKGTVTHSGVVRVVERGTILIESKWGPLGCYLHRPEDQPYGQRFTYYRSARKGHVLAGLAPPGQAGAAASLAAPASAGH
jgi:hypothetical protein